MAQACISHLRRAGEPDEIVGAVLYFTGGASSYTTGAALTVDGGAQWSLAGGGDQAAAIRASVFKGEEARS